MNYKCLKGFVIIFLFSRVSGTANETSVIETEKVILKRGEKPSGEARFVPPPPPFVPPLLYPGWYFVLDNT